MSSVRVIQVVILHASGVTMESEWTMSNATADVFRDGVLTISRESDGEEVKHFLSDEWRAASVIGDDGYEQFSFENTTTSVRAVPERVMPSVPVRRIG